MIAESATPAHDVHNLGSTRGFIMVGAWWRSRWLRPRSDVLLRSKSTPRSPLGGGSHPGVLLGSLRLTALHPRLSKFAALRLRFSLPRCTPGYQIRRSAAVLLPASLPPCLLGSLSPSLLHSFTPPLPSGSNDCHDCTCTLKQSLT